MIKHQIIELSKKLGKVLQAKSWRVVTTESCTGGGVAFALTSIAGSSAWFERGFVTYSNEAKQEVLGVQVGTLERYGAVSQETALEMAQGALKQSDSQVAISTTGIAGPGGGTASKPVGLVWFAIAAQDGRQITYKEHFSGNRNEVRERAIEVALERVIEFLTC